MANYGFRSFGDPFGDGRDNWNRDDEPATDGGPAGPAGPAGPTGGAGMTAGQKTTMRLWQNLEQRVLRGGGDLSYDSYDFVDGLISRSPRNSALRGGSQGPPVRRPLPPQDPLHRFMR